MGKPFPEPPRSAVIDGNFQLGRYSKPFERINFLDAKRLWHYNAPRWVKFQRLKEWRTVLMGDERWFFLSSLYNAKLFSLAIFKAWDRIGRRRYGFTRIVPGGIVALGDHLSQSHAFYHGRHARLDYDFNLDAGRLGLTVNWRPGHHIPGFHGEFVMSYGPKISAPSTVLLPLGLNRAMYSTKALMPMEGFFEAGGETHRFAKNVSTAFFDDNKGYYPFSLRYDWVCGFGIDAKGRRLGFNLANSQVRDSSKWNENCIWIGNKVWPLPAVRVTRATGHAGDWVIQDTEGLVDLVFTPAVANDFSFHLGLFESDWHGPFGSFKGFVKNGEGETIEAELFQGMGEEKYLRV